MEGIHVKTETHFSKGKRTQIIHVQTGTEEMLSFPPFKYDKKGKVIPNTWERPIIKKHVVHHIL